MKYKIGDIVDIIDGDRGSNYPKQDEFFNSGYCLFLDTGNVRKDGFSFEETHFITEEKCNALRKGKMQRGDIAYTTRGTVGNAAYFNNSVPFEYIRINSGMVILRAKSDKVISSFLYQLLKHDSCRTYIKGYCTGSAQPQLPIKNLSQIEIDIPSLAKQERISSVMTAYDSLIENNQKQIKLLEEAAQRLYKEWFVDLHFPGYENNPVVDRVPEGWKAVSLGDAIDFDPKVKLDKERVKEFVPMSALSTSSMVLDSSEFSETMSNSGSKFQNGDTLLARITPCLENGKTAYVWGIKSAEGAVGSTEYIVMRSKTLNPYMVYLITRTDDFRKTAINSMSGSDGRQRVKPDKLKVIPYLQPSDCIVNMFEVAVKPIFERIYVLNHMNAELKDARDRLLPMLMNEEIEV